MGWFWGFCDFDFGAGLALGLGLRVGLVGCGTVGWGVWGGMSRSGGCVSSKERKIFADIADMPAAYAAGIPTMLGRGGRGWMRRVVWEGVSGGRSTWCFMGGGGLNAEACRALWGVVKSAGSGPGWGFRAPKPGLGPEEGLGEWGRGAAGGAGGAGRAGGLEL